MWAGARGRLNKQTLARSLPEVMTRWLLWSSGLRRRGAAAPQTPKASLSTHAVELTKDGKPSHHRDP